MLRPLRVFIQFLGSQTRTVSSHMAGLTRPEIYTVVNRYIGVKDGYLGDFSYRTHTDFYPLFCDLDIDPNQYEGTTRERFIEILSKSTPEVQAAIDNARVAETFREYGFEAGLDRLAASA
jgi:hypothetical protein